MKYTKFVAQYLDRHILNELITNSICFDDIDAAIHYLRTIEPKDIITIEIKRVQGPK